jgi:plastocyanin
MRRFAVLFTTVIALLPIAAQATTKTVDMANYSFTPSNTTIAMGTTLTWHNTTASTDHTATQYTKLHLWNTGTVSGGASVSRTISFAGSYPYHCVFHYFLGMVGKISVPIAVSPSSGSTSITFTVTVATEKAPAAFVYDIQKKKGSGSWTSFRNGITSRRVSFHPPSTGKFSFRSRVRRLSNDGTSGWSPARTISVT